MPITSTQTIQTNKGDGMNAVEYIHTFASGRVVRDGIRFYPTGTDLGTQAALCAANMNETVKAEELREAVFDNSWDYEPTESTNNELAAYCRELYKNSGKETLAKVAKRILEWIVNGRFTDTQVRNAFNLTVGQWTTLKTKMQSLVASYDSIEQASGE